MAHIQQLLFVKNIVQVLGVQNVENVVEIGSWDVNGSVRTEFPKSNYLGLDVSEGKGVDRVYDGKDLSFLQSNSVEVVISCECFEHNPHWRDNLHDMIRICKPGGFIIATMASRGRPEHGTTRSRSGSSISTSIGWDYYHNITRKEFIRALQTEPLHRHYVAYNPYSKDLYAVLWKKNGSSAAKEDRFNVVEKVARASYFPKFKSHEFQNSLNSMSVISRSLWLSKHFFTYKLPALLLSYLVRDEQYQNFLFWRSSLSNPNSKEQ